MVPPLGRKTFTSQASLTLAHRMRRRADAILTGSGTILADRPEFTVRHVPDHPGKSRILAILDRGGRVPADYLAAYRSRIEAVTLDDLKRVAAKYLNEKKRLTVILGDVERFGKWPDGWQSPVFLNPQP